MHRSIARGTVTDTSREALSGVQITVLRTAAGLHRETLTSPTGTHDIPELPVGVYRVTYITLPDGSRFLGVHAAPGKDDGPGVTPYSDVGELRRRTAFCEAQHLPARKLGQIVELLQARRNASGPDLAGCR